MGMWAAGRCLRESAAPTTSVQICGSFPSLPVWCPSPRAHCKAARNGSRATWCHPLETEIPRDTHQLLPNVAPALLSPPLSSPKRASPEPQNGLSYPSPHPSSPRKSPKLPRAVGIKMNPQPLLSQVPWESTLPTSCPHPAPFSSGFAPTPSARLLVSVSDVHTCCSLYLVSFQSLLLPRQFLRLLQRLMPNMAS